MELITYTKKECRQATYRKAKVRITAKTGTVSFSSGFVAQTDVNPGDKLAFHQDKDRPRDWYVSKTDSPDGMRLRNQSNGQLIFMNKGLVRKILRSLNCEGGSVSFKISTVPLEERYYAIITSNAL